MRASLLSKDQFKSLVHERGWSLSNLAWRWGISLEHLLREIAHEQRNPRWDDAARGLPNLSPDEAREIRAQRLAARAPTSKRKPPSTQTQCGSGYRYRGTLIIGSVLYVLNDLGEIPEGTRGVVRRIDDNGFGERYQIEFDDEFGTFWMPPDEIDASLANSGEVTPL